MTQRLIQVDCDCQRELSFHVAVSMPGCSTSNPARWAHENILRAPRLKALSRKLASQTSPHQTKPRTLIHSFVIITGGSCPSDLRLLALVGHNHGEKKPSSNRTAS